MQWRRNPQFSSGDFRYAFGETGVLVVSDTARSEIAWGHFADLVETDDVYLLMAANNVGHLVPRRSFSSLEDESRFRELAERHCDAVSFRP